MSAAEKVIVSEEHSDDGSGIFKWNDHTKSTAALCLCMASMSYMIISVFPYSGFMAIHLVNGVTEESAGTYAGLIASSFMVGRALTSTGWGRVADLYGRKFTLMTSLALSCVFMLLFGTAQSFAMALVARFFLGLSNGIASAGKTAVSELAKGSATLEKRCMGLVVGMWGWGFLWSPALSGYLAEPATQYPNSSLVQAYKPFLERFPFLLPNLVGVIMGLVSMIAVEAWVPETLPLDKCRCPTKIPADTWKWTVKMQKKLLKCCCERGTQEEQIHLAAGAFAAATARTSIDSVHVEDQLTTWTPDNLREIRMRHSESGTMLSTQVTNITPRPSLIYVQPLVAKRISRMSDLSSQQTRRSSIDSGPTLTSIWNRVDTRVHLILYWIFSFVQVCMDEAFPLYCMSKEGGLSLTETSIGKILSISGLVFGICQYFVYANIVNRVGLYESLQIGSLCLPIVALIPFSVFFRSHDDTVSWARITYLCLILATSRIIASVFYSSIFIALNRTVPASERATMNGLQTLGGSVSKGIGPTFAGLLVAFSVSSGVLPPRVGGFFIWFVIGAMGIVNSLAVTCLLREAQVGDKNGGGIIETETVSKV